MGIFFNRTTGQTTTPADETMLEKLYRLRDQVGAGRLVATQKDESEGSTTKPMIPVFRPLRKIMGLTTLGQGAGRRRIRYTTPARYTTTTPVVVRSALQSAGTFTAVGGTKVVAA